MPRRILESPPPAPQHEKFVKDLARELTSPGRKPQPLILEQRIAATRSRHIHVIWDAWKDLSDEQRTDVILDAYRQTEGEEVIDSIMIAIGVTAQESLAIGLLRFKVEPLRKRVDPIPLEDYQRAMDDEARNTVLGPKARELRYATEEDAKQAYERLLAALPGSAWAVVKEQPADY